ncbi:MAG: RagB/SusD family nutrient uptake outer membrane protein [candidate division KSB1 bacterium]|nr:RagB/SusD family nutrient uptake outer membrane protein [candidate division KSB1 bacterium]
MMCDNIQLKRSKYSFIGRLATLGVLLILALGSVACDSMVNVIDPDIVTPESLNSEAGITTMRAGTLGDLAVALSGSAAGHGATPGLILMSGLMSDEYDYSGTFPTRREADTRLVQNTNGTVERVYANLHRARAMAEATLDLSAKFGGVPELESEMHSVIGYVYVFFGETFCSGVPFSKAPADGGELIYGEPQTTEQMFNAAVKHFDAALSAASGNDRLANLARVGKARALLGLGKNAEAAQTVASVPTDFVYNIEHSTNSRRQENGIYILTTVRRQWSIADGKGGNGLKYRSAMDPRVPWDGGTTFGQDDITLYYNQLKFNSSSSPVPLASGIEARLIEAEAAMQAGDNAKVAAIHNDLRATVGLDPVDLSGMSQDQVMDYHFKERAFWLYSTGHRLGDLRRMVRVYGRQVSEVFPWGPYFKGGEYGQEVTFPIPQSEANNPFYKGCLDRNP